MSQENSNEIELNDFKQLEAKANEGLKFQREAMVINGLNPEDHKQTLVELAELGNADQLDINNKNLQQKLSINSEPVTKPEKITDEKLNKIQTQPVNPKPEVQQKRSSPNWATRLLEGLTSLVSQKSPEPKIGKENKAGNNHNKKDFELLELNPPHSTSTPKKNETNPAPVLPPNKKKILSEKLNEIRNMATEAMELNNLKTQQKMQAQVQKRHEHFSNTEPTSGRVDKNKASPEATSERQVDKKKASSKAKSELSPFLKLFKKTKTTSPNTSDLPEKKVGSSADIEQKMKHESASLETAQTGVNSNSLSSTSDVNLLRPEVFTDLNKKQNVEQDAKLISKANLSDNVEPQPNSKINSDKISQPETTQNIITEPTAKSKNTIVPQNANPQLESKSIKEPTLQSESKTQSLSSTAPSNNHDSVSSQPNQTLGNMDPPSPSQQSTPLEMKATDNAPKGENSQIEGEIPGEGHITTPEGEQTPSGENTFDSNEPGAAHAGNPQVDPIQSRAAPAHNPQVDPIQSRAAPAHNPQVDPIQSRAAPAHNPQVDPIQSRAAPAHNPQVDPIQPGAADDENINPGEGSKATNDAVATLGDDAALAKPYFDYNGALFTVEQDTAPSFNEAVTKFANLKASQAPNNAMKNEVTLYGNWTANSSKAIASMLVNLQLNIIEGAGCRLDKDTKALIDSINENRNQKPPSVSQGSTLDAEDINPGEESATTPTPDDTTPPISDDDISELDDEPGAADANNPQIEGHVDPDQPGADADEGMPNDGTDNPEIGTRLEGKSSTLGDRDTPKGEPLSPGADPQEPLSRTSDLNSEDDEDPLPVMDFKLPNHQEDWFAEPKIEQTLEQNNQLAAIKNALDADDEEDVLKESKAADPIKDPLEHVINLFPSAPKTDPLEVVPPGNTPIPGNNDDKSKPTIPDNTKPADTVDKSIDEDKSEKEVKSFQPIKKEFTTPPEDGQPLPIDNIFNPDQPAAINNALDKHGPQIKLRLDLNIKSPLDEYKNIDKEDDEEDDLFSDKDNKDKKQEDAKPVVSLIEAQAKDDDNLFKDPLDPLKPLLSESKTVPLVVDKTDLEVTPEKDEKPFQPINMAPKTNLEDSSLTLPKESEKKIAPQGQDTLLLEIEDPEPGADPKSIKDNNEKKPEGEKLADPTKDKGPIGLDPPIIITEIPDNKTPEPSESKTDEGQQIPTDPKTTEGEDDEQQDTAYKSTEGETLLDPTPTIPEGETEDDTNKNPEGQTDTPLQSAGQAFKKQVFEVAATKKDTDYLNTTNACLQKIGQLKAEGRDLTKLRVTVNGSWENAGEQSINKLLDSGVKIKLGADVSSKFQTNFNEIIAKREAALTQQPSTPASLGSSGAGNLVTTNSTDTVKPQRVVGNSWVKDATTNQMGPKTRSYGY